jgi:hypothetical protein
MLRPLSSTAHLVTSRRRDGLRLFFESLRDNISLDLRLDVELRKPSVLPLELLHPGHQRHVHTAEFAPPPVERRQTDPVLSIQIRHRRPSLRLLQHRQDLLSVNLGRFI